MSVAELREILEGVILTQKETSLQMKETDRRMQETDRRMQETDRRMQETERQMKDTDLRIKKMNASIERMSSSIGREWGHLVESLTKTSCLEQMQSAGIKVTQTAMETESERPGYEQEWDVLLVNGGELVAVEVKSRFREGDLTRVEKKLAVFTKAFPQYTNYKIYGAVAALKYDAGLEKRAEKRGLYVFQPSGEIMSLTNKDGFKPKAW